MSKSTQRYEAQLSGCFGKQAFESISVAMKAAPRREEKSRIRVYKCHFCGKYHIGSVPRSNSRQKTK